MHKRDRLGFCLMVFGAGLAFLLYPFLLDREYLSQVLLIALAACALCALFFGALFLYKHN
jgi:hypothetical protein